MFVFGIFEFFTYHYSILGNVKLIERSIERFGISSSLFAKCEECGMEEFMATGEHDGDQETTRTIHGKNINRRVDSRE